LERRTAGKLRTWPVSQGSIISDEMEIRTAQRSLGFSISRARDRARAASCMTRRHVEGSSSDCGRQSGHAATDARSSSIEEMEPRPAASILFRAFGSGEARMPVRQPGARTMACAATRAQIGSSNKTLSIV
jgi:hypothetical protein